jgi:hypothetical protein
VAGRGLVLAVGNISSLRTEVNIWFTSSATSQRRSTTLCGYSPRLTSTSVPCP